jgi:drug/metabolite transporter (DMT)-like permease
MQPPGLGKAYFALACVCVFWGTTYLGIRIAVESFPPAIMVAIRFLLSGSILTAIALAKGAHLPRGRELWQTGLLGFLILGVGNGSLAWAELNIPSGLASLFVTISPFWLVGIEALIPGGAKLHGPTIWGMAVGFAGTALLVMPDPHAQYSARTLLIGFAICQLGVAGWCLGSIIQRRIAMQAHPVVTGGVQQLAAGLGFIPIAMLIPNHHIVWNTRGVGAILYLAAFGSIVGYSAYVYALGKLPISIFSIYPYVNAVVAVGLGWLFYREAFGLREMAAMSIIFAGVGIVKWQSGKAQQAARPIVVERVHNSLDRS